LNAYILTGNAVTADSGKPRRFIPMVGKLRLSDIFCAAHLDEWHYLKLIGSCCLIINVCFIYQCVYTSSWSWSPAVLPV